MDEETCLICTLLDKGDITAAFAEITDRGLLVRLACDIADHVADLGPNRAQTRAWLRATRDYQADPKAAKSAAENTREAWSKAEKANSPTWKAARAAAWATSVSNHGEAAAWMTWQTAWAAAEAVSDPHTERDWQVRHTRKSACTCITPLSPHAIETRSRTSLLAS